MNRQLGIRKSALGSARDVALSFLGKGLQTIVFAPSRLSTEVLVTYLKEALETRPGSEGIIRGYRGGYLPLKRREIERGLREGSVLGVVSTNALELGIDIGSLDAAVLLGYPGQRGLGLAAGGPRGARGPAPRWRSWWPTRRPSTSSSPRTPTTSSAPPPSRAASTPTTCRSCSPT